MNAPRALVLAAVIAATGCGSSGPGDDAPSAPLGTGIPIAPPGAVGVRFDETARMAPTSTGKTPAKGAPTPMPTIPPDPFDPLAEDPPKGKTPGPTPKIEIKKIEEKKEMHL